MIVYKFLDASFGLQALAMGRLKVSTLSDMNDPIEALGAFRRGKERRMALSASRKKLEKSVGFLCFSTSWQGPVLWSYYADKHRGVCLGFAVPDNVLQNVSYEDKPIDVNVIHDPEGFRLSPSDEDRLLLTKYSGWRQ